DAPADPVRLFTSANVDRFTYSGSSKRSRHTIAFVTWNDPSDDYKQNIEVVEDPEGIALYGTRITEITAFGCTSRGQAHRVGKWLLFSERVETETVTFVTGTEGIPLRPGEVIKIGDTKRAGRRWWGRIKAATTTTIELDSPVTLSNAIAYTLTIVLPNGNLEEKSVINSAGIITVLSVSPAYSTPPQAEASWMLSSSELSEKLYRVVAIAESEPHKYEVTALVHNSGKYVEVEQGIKLEASIPGSTPSFPPNPPRNPVASSSSAVNSVGNSIFQLQFSWDYPLSNGTKDPFTVVYLVQYKNGAENAWISQTVATQSIDIPAIEGEYYLRVAAIDTLENTSLFVEAPGSVSSDYANLVFNLNTSQHSIIMTGAW
ncbi:MAG: phage tail protein, partial [Crinalium sp.]